MSHSEDEVPLSEEGAKALVERIADEHGYVSEDVCKCRKLVARLSMFGDHLKLSDAFT